MNKDIQHITKAVFITMGLIFSIQQTYAQFTISEDFRGSADPDVIIGDDAILTSGIADPINDGWLRLTSDANNQQGYAFVDRSFPSTLGVLLDFEYKMWRSQEPGGLNGADGFSIYLFDAQYGPSNFQLGAYGGSLGYANSNNNPPGTNTPGLTGGYIGIGFDAYGNFVMESEDKKGGSTALSPNSIAIRGATTSNFYNSNPYLTGVTIDENNNVTDALSMSGNSNDDVVDYNTQRSTRPPDNVFYRRVQVEITPTVSGTYNIVVRWAKTYGGALVELLNYTTSDVPPTLLKVGFAASTGGGVNYHEIRNLRVTTPDNVRVSKFANKSVLVPGEEITYTIEVDNDTDAQLNNVFFSDSLTNGNGVLIPDADFDITSITTSGFISETIPSSSTSNLVTGNFSIGAQDIAYITIIGTLNNPVSDNLLRNVVYINPTDITDEDLTNNTAVVTTPIQGEDIDLIIENTPMSLCTDAVNGNTFSMKVVNVGNNDADYGDAGWYELIVKITKTIPSGYGYDDSATPGGFSGYSRHWDRNVQGNTYTYTIRGDGTIQGGGFAFPYPIVYTIDPPSASTTYTDETIISYEYSFGWDAESGNTANNTTSIEILPVPNLPAVNSPIVYCIGETATPLTATPDSENSLLWYLNPGGFGNPNAPTPSTATGGITTYYVAQTNGNCDSELEEIDVVVMDPQPGAISGTQEICMQSAPSTIVSTSVGTGTGTISYKWEYSNDGGLTWDLVFGQTQATLQAPILSETTAYRRITVDSYSNPSKSCESDPTTEVTITVKRCKIITNPMLPSMAGK